jgi:hypothetical protein
MWKQISEQHREALQSSVHIVAELFPSHLLRYRVELQLRII